MSKLTDIIEGLNILGIASSPTTAPPPAPVSNTVNIKTASDGPATAGGQTTVDITFDAAAKAPFNFTVGLLSDTTAQANTNYSPNFEYAFINASGASAFKPLTFNVNVLNGPIGSTGIRLRFSTLATTTATELHIFLSSVGGGLVKPATADGLGDISHSKITITPQVAATKLLYGVNTHPLWGAATNYYDTALYDPYLTVCQERNLKKIRFDVWIKGLNTANCDAFVATAAGNGLLLNAMCYLPDDTNVHNIADLNVLYANGYNFMKTFAERYRNNLYSVELGNETAARIPSWKTGPKNWAASNYDTTISIRIIYQMRGMADAVKWVNSTYQKNIKIGVNCEDYKGGCLEIYNNGVTGSNGGVGNNFNSYHWYPKSTYSLNTYSSDIGVMNIYDWLNGFGKPFDIGEFNDAAGSMAGFYDATVDLNEQYQSVKNALAEFEAAKNTRPLFEGVSWYQLLDMPHVAGTQGPAEANAFGLMSTINAPKPILYVASMYAKGLLTASDRAAIIATGKWTDAEITALLNR